MKRTQIAALVLVLLAIAVVVVVKATTTAAPAASPTPAPMTNAPLPKLVDLGSTTCIPCKEMAPILEELRQEYKGQVEVEFINVSDNVAAADEYRISVIPTQIFLDADGKEVFRHEGFFPKADILAQFEKMGVKTR